MRASASVCLIAIVVTIAIAVAPRSAGADAAAGAGAVGEPTSVLAAGEARRLRIEPASSVRVRLAAMDASFVEVRITFSGAEVLATLWDGATAIATGCAPERSRGRVTVWAEIPSASASTSASERAIELSVEVVRDYTRAADVTIEWQGRRPATDADRESAASARAIADSIEDWRSGQADRLTRAVARLETVAPRLRKVHAERPLFEALLVAGVIQLDLSRRDPAVAALTEAVSLARDRGDANDHGLALLKLGLVRAVTGDIKDAQPLLQQALALRQQADDARGQAEALLALATTDANSGKQAEGLAAIERATPMAIDAGDRRLVSAFENMRALILQQTGRAQQAVEPYERALALRRAIGDRPGEGQVLSNMGVLWRELGDVRRGNALLEEALVIRRATGHPQSIANTLFNLGIAQMDLGRYERGIDHFMESLPIWRAAGGRRGEAFTLQNLGLAAARLGDDPRARVYYEQALPLWQQVGDRRGEGIVLNLIAQLALRDGDLDRAAAFVERALVAVRAANARRQEGEALATSGALLRRRGDYDGSIARLRDALALHTASRSRIPAATAHMELALTFEAAGRWTDARTEMETALALREATLDTRGQMAALAGLARLDRQAGLLADAQTGALRAVDLLEQVRAGLRHARGQIAFGVTTQSVYALARDVLLDRHAIDPSAGYDRTALEIHERARARSLLDALANGPMPSPPGGDGMQALTAKQRDLEADLEAATARLGRLTDAGQPADRIAAVRADLSRIAVSLDEVKADIRRQSPSYAALVHPQPMSAAAIQALLDADTLLIEIALGTRRSVGWLVSPTEVRTVMLPPRAAIEEAAGRLLTALTARSQIPEGETADARRRRIAAADRAWRSESERLASLVLAPFGEIHARRIAVVTEGRLARVPFALLPINRGARTTVAATTPRTPRTDGAGPVASAGDAAPEIVVLPSASVLAELRRRAATRPPRTIRAAVLADPVFRADDPRVTTGAAGASSRRTSGGPDAVTRDSAMRDGSMPSLGTLPRLIHSREEASVIRSLASRSRADNDRVVVAVDFDASLARLADPALTAPEVLHLATHALVDDEQPELSGIVLSLVDARGAPQRGFLALAGVYDVPVQADLVVLSACRTAAGPDVPGEGLVSLTSGFMHAGTPRVMASLWSVDDRATAAFMRAFYQGLFGRGLSASAALRGAQETMRRSREWASPYYWAAFTLHGDWR